MMKKFPALSFVIFLTFSISIFPQAFEWEWQNPRPTGADHNDAVVLSLNKFILAGNGGSVQISTDAGSNWSASYIDSLKRDIYSCTFVNENIGYLAGTGGLLSKTTNGGASWSELISGTASTLWDVDFINPDTGFVVGAGGAILYTTNGGASWTTTNYGTTTLYKIHFIDSNVGYLGSASSTTGRLLKTTDGGSTWNDISANVPGLAGTVRGIHFFDLNTGWISNSQGRIFKTTDGGVNWSQVYDIGSTTTTIYEVKFIDFNDGYAISSTGRVLKTTDSGASWTLTQTEATKNLYGLGLLNVQSKGALSPMLIGGDAGTILVSMNDGATWELGHTAASQDLLYRASFVSETIGYVSGGTTSSGDLLKTTDGGLTWTKLSINPGERFYSVHFLNENLGYAGTTGPTGLYKTTDGGQSWTTLNTGTGVSTSIIYDIKFFDNNLGLAMYSSGQVARTTDGGSNWTTISAGWGAAAGYNIFFVDASNIYICGAGGRISKSVDGGASFAQLPSLGTATLYYLHFFNSTTGFVAASGGRLFKTVDGFNFTESQLPVSTIFYSIKFSDTNTGWLGGSGGNLFYTEDGGNSWIESALSIGPSQTIREIVMSGNRMWTIGSDGMIIRGYADPQIPVELSAFSASLSGNNITLNWITSSELNNRGFGIERKNVDSNNPDNSEWVEIGFLNGNGTTTGITRYSYTDKELSSGIYTYRLKQIDFGGTFTYYNLPETVEISLPWKFDLAQNYPNPFNPNTRIHYSLPQNGLVTIKVFNVIGQEVAELVNEFKSAGAHSVEFDAGSLPSGVYMYKLASGNFSATKKMLLVK